MERSLGRYQIIERLSPGEFKGIDPSRRVVLIRNVSAVWDSPRHEADSALLIRATHVLKTLVHPNIVALIDTFEHEDQWYVVTEFVEGETISSLLRRGITFEPQLAMRFTSQIASAIDYAHGKGVIDTAITPSKLLLCADDAVKLVDYGVASLQRAARGPTRAGLVMGPASYFAPEQIMGWKADGRTDLFSFGVVAFEMLAGQKPFRDEGGFHSVVFSVMKDDPIEPSDLGARGFDASAWQEVFRKALAKVPADRYETAGAFAEDLDRLVTPRRSKLNTYPSPQASTIPPAPAPPTAAAPDPPLPRPAPSASPTPVPAASPRESPTETVATPTVSIPRPSKSSDTGAMPRFPIEAPGSPSDTGAMSRVEKQATAPARSVGSGGPLTSLLDGVKSAAGAAADTIRSWVSGRAAKGDAPPVAIAKGDPRLEAVEASVFAPEKIPFGEDFLVQVFVHLLEQRRQAVRMAKLFDAATSKRGFRTLARRVARGTTLTFDLRIPGLAVKNPVQTLTWNGRPESVQFGVTWPADASETVLHTFIGTVTVSIGSAPVGHIKFKVQQVGIEARHRGRKASHCEAHHYNSVFVSYASEDRDKVLARIQMLASLRIPYFQDILSLDPGDRWERALYRHIDECDLFLLFWSKAARESDWVLKEVRYALDRKQGRDDAPPEIKPVILEGPPMVPPPPELDNVHFDDRLVYFMNAGQR
jgi:serine/threonine protein kinase